MIAGCASTGLGSSQQCSSAQRGCIRVSSSGRSSHGRANPIQFKPKQTQSTQTTTAGVLIYYLISSALAYLNIGCFISKDLFVFILYINITCFLFGNFIFALKICWSSLVPHHNSSQIHPTLPSTFIFISVYVCVYVCWCPKRSGEACGVTSGYWKVNPDLPQDQEALKHWAISTAPAYSK